MGFSGYYQFLCKNGHCWGEDCYGWLDKICYICKEKAVWGNLVDTTNGSFDEDGNRIDGHIELEIESETKCEHCNSILEIRYKIPKKKGKHLI